MNAWVGVTGSEAQKVRTTEDGKQGLARPGSEVKLLADVRPDDLIVLLAVVAEHLL